MQQVLHNPLELPDDLPVPVDDGAARHLAGLPLPDVTLTATDGARVNLSRLPGRTVVYIYPRTGRPGQALPTGWNGIPGARGCTPQSCSFRDHFDELRGRGVRSFTVSRPRTATISARRWNGCICRSPFSPTPSLRSSARCGCRPSRWTEWSCSSAWRW